MFLFAFVIGTARIMNEIQEASYIKEQSYLLDMENTDLLLQQPSFKNPWKNLDIPIYKVIFDENEKSWKAIRAN